jgi:hypothetical protein
MRGHRSGQVTVSLLAQILCLASGIFGRPAWDGDKCAERAMMIQTAAAAHSLDPLLMVAIDVQECDLRDRDNPVYRVVRGRRQLVGYDACPMGVRILGAGERAGYDAAALYELAATRLERWRDWHARARHRGHPFVAHYNPGNPEYAAQVLAFWAALGGRPVKRGGNLTERTVEILRRLGRVLQGRS